MLDQKIAIWLLDLISGSLDDNKYMYQTLKDWPINTFRLLRKWERASHLLHFQPLGASKPSAPTDELLIGTSWGPFPCLLFEQLFHEYKDIHKKLCIQWWTPYSMTTDTWLGRLTPYGQLEIWAPTQTQSNNAHLLHSGIPDLWCLQYRGQHQRLPVTPTLGIETKPKTYHCRS